MGKQGIKDLGAKAKSNQATHDKARLRGEAILEDIANIKIASPFMDLFLVKREILEAIIKDMQLNGYDRSKPLDIWAEKGIVLDGHTRLEAAKQAGIRTVPIYKHSFKSRDEALDYALHNQRDRRNLTDAEILQCVKILDRLKLRGGDGKSPESKASIEAIDPGKSAEETARRIGTSRAKVERARAVAKSPEYRKAVQAGKQSISGAARKIQEKKKPGKPAAPRADYAALLKNLLDQLPEQRPTGLTDKQVEDLRDLAETTYFKIQGWLGA